MPPLSELPGEIKRKKLIRALERVGFIINKTGGAGSHVKAVWPATQKSSPYKLPFEKMFCTIY